MSRSSKGSQMGRRSRGRSSVRREPVVRRLRSPKEKVRDCCRKVVAFMCTQVGVGGLIVGYAVVGALGFVLIEGDYKDPEIPRVEELRANVSQLLWAHVQAENVFNRSSWGVGASAILLQFQEGVAEAVKAGYRGAADEPTWTFPAALMFCLSVFTMIGYGNIVPRTGLGKAGTVVYAVLGIPLYVLYFMNMGKVLASVFKWAYTKVYHWTREHEAEEDEEEHDVVVPSTACLWLLGAYVATGTIMFAEWERWRYLDSVYFCVTSLCKIGIGDFVPGASFVDSPDQQHTKLIINFVYLLLGMGLIAMCYNLMKEVVKVKMHHLKEDMLLCFEQLRLKLLACYGDEELDD